MLTGRAAAIVVLGTMMAARGTRADLITPVASSFALTAESQVSYNPTVTSTDTASQAGPPVP